MSFKMQIREFGLPIIKEVNPVNHWGDGVFEIIVWLNDNIKLESKSVDAFTSSYGNGFLGNGVSVDIMTVDIHTQINVPNANFDWYYTEIAIKLDENQNQLRIYLENENSFSKFHKEPTRSGCKQIELDIVEGI